MQCYLSSYHHPSTCIMCACVHTYSELGSPTILVYTAFQYSQDCWMVPIMASMDSFITQVFASIDL